MRCLLFSVSPKVKEMPAESPTRQNPRRTSRSSAGTSYTEVDSDVDEADAEAEEKDSKVKAKAAASQAHDDDDDEFGFQEDDSDRRTLLAARKRRALPSSSTYLSVCVRSSLSCAPGRCATM